MANASSDLDDVNRIHDEVESLPKKKRSRISELEDDITELEDRLARKRELLVELTRRTPKKARVLEIAPEVSWQALAREGWVLRRAHEEFESLMKTEHARLTELEDSPAERNEVMEETTRKIREMTRKLKIAGEMLWKANPSVLPKVQESDELSGGFDFFCHILHLKMACAVYMMLPEFFSSLRNESLYFGVHSRWSGPLHMQLAEHLEEMAFSTEDWDLSLLRKDGGDPMCTPEEVVAADVENPVSPSSLSKEQLSLMERIATFQRSLTNRHFQFWTPHSPDDSC